MTDQLIIKLTADTKKALNGVMDEYLASVTREETVKESEKDHRSDMIADAIKRFDIPKEYMKNLLEIHAREKKRHAAEVTTETLELYETLREANQPVGHIEHDPEEEFDELLED